MSLMVKTKDISDIVVEKLSKLLFECDNNFVNDIIDNIRLGDKLNIDIHNMYNDVSVKEEANALVSYAFRNQILEDFHSKKRTIDDNTIDNILDDSHYFICNWLIMKFSIPSMFYNCIVNIMNKTQGSYEWNKSNYLANIDKSYIFENYDIEILDDVNIIKEALSNCSSELKKYIDMYMEEILNDRFINYSYQAIKENIIMLQEFAFISPFQKLHEENKDFLYTNDRIKRLMIDMTNKTSEYLYFLNNLYNKKCINHII